MVAAFYQSLTYKIENKHILIGEMDCVRIINQEACEIFEKVNYSLVDIFGLGSTENAALLFDSYEAFEAKDARADRDRRAVEKEDLLLTVENIIEAAQFELDNLKTQKKLLKAASYGKLFVTEDISDLSDMFVETCKSLRVINAIRNAEIGMPVTYTQYQRLTPVVIIRRLIYRRFFFLSFFFEFFLSFFEFFF